MTQPIGQKLPDWSPPDPPPGNPVEGSHCRLVRLDPDLHARDLFESNALDTKDLNWTYLPYGPFASFEDYQNWVTEVTSKNDPLFYAIVDSKTNRATGVASLMRIKPASGSIEIGHLNFSPLLQRTTAPTESMYLMISHAFDLGYRRVEWKCDSLNAPSRAAALRLGFTFEGIFRQATVYKERNRDTTWYAIIDSDWPSIRETFLHWLSPENFDDRGAQKHSLGALAS